MLRFSLIVLAICFSSIGFSQEEGSYVYGDEGETVSPAEEGGFSWERVVIGGGLGLSFGDYTVIEVAPDIGYYLSDNVLLGVGGRYSYYKDNILNQSTDVYGGRLYSEYLFTNLPLLAHVETEMISIELIQDGRLQRKSIYNFYVGGGLKQAVGGRSYFYILGLWNLNETQESYILQPNPILRGGIAIGF